MINHVRSLVQFEVLKCLIFLDRQNTCVFYLLVRTQAHARNQQEPMLSTSGSNKPAKIKKAIYNP